MHIGEAIMPRDEAIALARETLVASLERLDQYYDRKPGMRPEPEGALPDLIRADETWIFVPFRRVDPDADPCVVRVNGITKAASIEPTENRRR